MKREERYIVIKQSDLDAAVAAGYLSAIELAALAHIRNNVDRVRYERRKEPLACVCVESDWPEYEPVWKMIEDRVNGVPEPAPEGYFAYSDDAGYEEFDTAEEAKDRALTEIDLYREDAADGWPEQVDNVCWGIIVQRAKGFDQQDIPTDDPNHTYQTCDYRLEPVIPAGGEHGN